MKRERIENGLDKKQKAERSPGKGKKSMKLKEIETLLHAAIHEAEGIDIKITAVFLDEGGHLRALLRMDDACWGDIDFAINKAYTAAAWRADSGSFYEDSKPDGDFFGMHFSNGLRVTTFPGGMPINCKGRFVGSIGVSGGSPPQDQQCLDAVKAALLQLEE